MTTRVLVIGSQDLADLVERLLGDPSAYEIDLRETYLDALKALVRNQHDVCLMDQHVSGTGLTSIEILKRVNAGGCTIPVILVTTLEDSSIDWAAEDSGAAGFLNRDLDLTERTLKHVIRYSISHFKQLQEMQEHMAEIQKQLADMGRKLRR